MIERVFARMHLHLVATLAVLLLQPAPLRAASRPDDSASVQRVLGAVPSSVRISAPAAGAAFRWGETRRIRWRGGDSRRLARKVRISLSTDGGVRWRSIAVLAGNPGYYDWQVQEVPGVRKRCLLKVALIDARRRTVGLGRTPGCFTIVGPASRYTLGAVEDWYTTTYSLGKAAAGDLDGDGRTEIVALANDGTGWYHALVFRREADGTLPILHTLTTWGFIDLKDVAVGDLNGDGRADLAFTGLSTLGGAFIGRLLVLYQDPVTGAVAASDSQKIFYSDVVGSLAIGDLNGDGRADVAALAESTFPSGQGAVSLFRQSPTGVLLDERRYEGCPVAVDGGVAIAEMSGDGLQDLVIRSGPRQIAVIPQDPLEVQTGLAAAPELLAVGEEGAAPVSSFAVGDLNNDGRADLAAAAGGLLHVFRRADAGGFAPAGPIALASEPRSLAVADVDGDRLNDLLFDRPDRLGWVQQTFSHGFSEPRYRQLTCQDPGPVLPGSVRQEDVNADGIPDLVVSGYRGHLYLIPGAPIP